MEFKDYYAVMGLKPEASTVEIKRAYRKLARKYHPDVSSEKDAEERFKELGEAYEVLKDPKKRAAYDNLYQQGWKAGERFSAPPNWETVSDFQDTRFAEGGVENFSDFFETLFGRRGFSGWRQQPSSHRGQDVHYILEIELEEAYRGSSRRIEIKTPEIDQFGKVTETKRIINVKIPKGVTQGQLIRLRGQGGKGQGKAANGDLYLEIRIRPNPNYYSEGKDITLTLPVSPWEAALGAKIITPTLGGKIEVKIPPNSQTGSRLRLRGRGLPGNPPGDEYIILQVVTPPADSKEAKSLYQEMAAKISFNPRQKLGI
jgi:curved DNA-binding protein